MTKILGKRRRDDSGGAIGARRRSSLDEESHTLDWKRHRVAEERPAPGTRAGVGDGLDQTVGQLDSGCIDHSYSEPAEPCKRAGARGHQYKHTNASDHARVQYGDQVFNVTGNCYLGASSLLLDPQRNSDSGLLHPAQPQDLRLYNTGTLTALLKVFIEILCVALPGQAESANAEGLLRRILEGDLPSEIPKQLHENVAYFEDAFGQRCRIDIDFISDWAAFDFLLRRKFKHRGLRKIQDGNYFLQDVSTTCLFDQRNRPRFRNMFTNGANISMSIYFDWDEIRHNSCPRCRTEEKYSPGVETVCRTCKFAYTPGVIKEVGAETSDGPESSTEILNYPQANVTSGPAVPNTDPDRPEHFNRVSIGAKVAEGISHSAVSPNEEAMELESSHHDGLSSPHPQDPDEEMSPYPGPPPSTAAETRDDNSRSDDTVQPQDVHHLAPPEPNSKRHKCPYCSTDFTRHHNLKSHLLTHAEEKPYVCQTCQARFRRLHDLKRHTKLHTGERPHTCDKCGRRFARGDALARHNKGPDGCGGRRSSFRGDDEFGPDGEGMEGVEYDEEGSFSEAERTSHWTYPLDRYRTQHAGRVSRMGPPQVVLDGQNTRY